MLILADGHFTNHLGRRAFRKKRHPKFNLKERAIGEQPQLWTWGGLFISALAASEDSWQYGLTELHAPPASRGIHDRLLRGATRISGRKMAIQETKVGPIPISGLAH